ncbi:protein-L-isoaspartate(D-aspartate) O-methyltransferase [Candidatus Micrarchaeota archaeon]|nr:protein-L-isoaspartate(D-aspartate) O-methyltransferase [Candidatus Micrarchaeota archaeon]
MESNKEMIEYLKKAGWIKSKEVEEAFKRVDRGLFAPPPREREAYEDYPLPVMKGQTISAPSIVAFMTEELDARKGMKILEVGTGSGYQACILSLLVGKKGRVITTDIHAELIDYARERTEKLGLKNIQFVYGDGSKGYVEKAPFDRIIVTAAAPSVPEPLVRQLKEGGRMVIPVGTFFQELQVVEKLQGKIKIASMLPVVFVPLLGEYGFKEG